MLTARPEEQGRAPRQNTPALAAVRSGAREPRVGKARPCVHGRRSGLRSGPSWAWLVVCLWAGQAFAAPPPVTVPVDPASFEAGAGATGPLGFLDGISRSGYMLGDMWGLRTFLSRYGMSFAVQETSELLGNVSGGARTGFAYDGLTQMILQLDTQRAFGLYGGLFNVSALQIHGNNLSAENLLTLQTASGIEADRATRLWELWYQQKFLTEDRLDIKIGQQSLDQEFIVSQNALLFVNTMFGWPMLPSADLPGGGPAYPLSALGVRVRARPTDSLTFLAGVFNGSPAPNNMGDSQQTNPSGTSFPLNGRVLAIAEMQYAYPSLGTMLYADQAEPLPRVYKLGFWYDSEDFASQDVDNTGLSLANPASTGIPKMYHGNYSIYAVADQMVWQDPAEADRTLNVFVRAMGTQWADRNLINFSLNAGLTFHEPFLHRDDDTFGIGMGYTHVSSSVSALDRQTAYYTGAFTPVRSGEAFVEVTYQYQVTPWWQIQPDFQYVFNPGAGVANPNMPNERVKNEAVIGIRTNITF
jgi:porin